RFAPLGEDGQQRLSGSVALVVGCGALGSVIANTLVRAGVGTVRIVDRDFVDLSNLQRQVLFDERDVERRMPKAVAAAERLRQINSEVAIEPVVADLSHENIARLAKDAGVIIDGTDNFEARLLINDYSVSTGTPWVYGGAVGGEGRVMAVLPGETACLTCLVPEPPAPGAMPTCDTAGVLGPTVNVVASLQSLEAMKILAGKRDAVVRDLMVVDVWSGRWRRLSVDNLHAAGTCETCHDRVFPWLEGERGGDADVLCGRNAVQLRPASPTAIDLPATAERLAGIGDVMANPFLLRLAISAGGDDLEITLFADGRAIVSGVDDPARARSLYAQYIGG
ncbi:MAG: ThiF family adenylyltransferase, partial [Planctomycetota bacterium]